MYSKIGVYSKIDAFWKILKNGVGNIFLDYLISKRILTKTSKIDVNDLLNSWRRVVFTLYVYNVYNWTVH